MVDFLRLENAALKVDVSPFGAALARVWITGFDTSLVLGLPKAEDYADAPQAIGVIVGPVAGRVSGASTIIDGAEYHLEQNTPPDCLHSGSQGLQSRLWEVESHSSDRLVLRCDLPDGACALPGNRTVRAMYILDGMELSLAITTHTDATTVINVTNHAYWTLDDHTDLSHHLLNVNTTQMCETGPDLIPTGQLIDTTGTDFDFSQPRNPVEGVPLDGCFCLSSKPTVDLRPIMKLQSSLSGLALEVDSDQSGVVLYTGEGLPRLQNPPLTPVIAPFSAIAIEAQAWPDANNRPNFPSIVLKAGTSCTQNTRFRLTLSR